MNYSRKPIEAQPESERVYGYYFFKEVLGTLENYNIRQILHNPPSLEEIEIPQLYIQRVQNL